jgi:hypothetical protein
MFIIITALKCFMVNLKFKQLKIVNKYGSQILVIGLNVYSLWKYYTCLWIDIVIVSTFR